MENIKGTLQVFYNVGLSAPAEGEKMEVNTNDIKGMNREELIDKTIENCSLGMTLIVAFNTAIDSCNLSNTEKLHILKGDK